MTDSGSGEDVGLGKDVAPYPLARRERYRAEGLWRGWALALVEALVVHHGSSATSAA